jgi:hypothetical protein
MAHSMAPKIHQTRFAVSMADTSGISRLEINPVDPSFDDFMYVFPQPFVPTNETRVTLPRQAR